MIKILKAINIKRLKFDKNTAHCLWLLKQMFKNFFMGDLDGAIEAYWFLRIHMSYKNKRIK